jgi:hypothetical protein
LKDSKRFIRIWPGLVFCALGLAAAELFAPGIGSTLSRNFASSPDAPATSRRRLEYFGGPGNGSSDVYWIDAAFLQKLRPK